VDHNNTGGFQTGEDAPIIAAFTDTGQSEVIAYSNDRGRTFTMYEGNPIIKNWGRDPKIFWYAPGEHWVIAVYQQVRVEGKARPLQTIAFYTSTNLKDWERQSHIEGFYECPEIFELPVDNDKANTKWVVFGANGKYAIGDFDGKTFTPDHEGKHQVHHGAFYASQCFNDDPKGRVVQIGWARIGMRDMSFNQTFTLPIHLMLRTTEKGLRMFAEPVEEIKSLRLEPLDTRLGALAPKEIVEIPLNLDIFELEMEIDAGAGRSLTLQFGDDRVHYEGGKLNGAPVSTRDGRAKIRLLVDRPMYELIGNDGECYITQGRRSSEPRAEMLKIVNGAKPLNVHSLKIYPLKSIWNR
jgi:fructan beta-fructosidase